MMNVSADHEPRHQAAFARKCHPPLLAASWVVSSLTEVDGAQDLSSAQVLLAL